MTASTLPSLPSRAILSAEERSMVASYVEERLHTGQCDFELAGKATGLHPIILRKLVRDGVLPGVAPYRVEGVVGTCDIQRARELAEKFAAVRHPVEGRGISIVAAVEKYCFARASIYEWVRRGWVQIVSTTAEGDRLYNEGDIAFARALADLVGHKSGKPLFPSKKS